jgi:hypothetical protein
VVDEPGSSGTKYRIRIELGNGEYRVVSKTKDEVRAKGAQSSGH